MSGKFWFQKVHVHVEILTFLKIPINSRPVSGFINILRDVIYSDGRLSERLAEFEVSLRTFL
jgi:hypothetical protein